MRLWFRSQKPQHVEPRCSFCKKGVDDASVLITAEGVAICDECVGRCSELLWKKALESESVGEGEVDETKVTRATCQTCTVALPVSKMVHLRAGSNLCPACVAALRSKSVSGIQQP